jgi:hypothetical protein
MAWAEHATEKDLRRIYGAANTKFSKKARRFPTYSALLHHLYRSNAAILRDLTRKMSWQEYFGSGWPIAPVSADESSDVADIFMIGVWPHFGILRIIGLSGNY